MNNPTTILKEKARAEQTVSKELSNISITALAISATAIGCWAVVALFAGAGSSGGPLDFLNALVSTITG